MRIIDRFFYTLLASLIYYKDAHLMLNDYLIIVALTTVFITGAWSIFDAAISFYIKKKRVKENSALRKKFKELSILKTGAV